MKRLAIVCSHPVQYYAPLFRLMAKNHCIKVFYSSSAKHTKYDKGFRLNIDWDIPLLEGYDFEFTHHVAKIQAFKPTAIMIYGWAYFSHLRIIRYFHLSVPLYFKGDSTLLDLSSAWKTRVKKLWLKYVYSHLDYVFYVGKSNKAYFLNYGITGKQLIYSPHAIDNERFSEDRHYEAGLIRKNFDIKDGDILLLFTGKLILKKGPQLLLKAFMELNLPNVHVLFVGSGLLESALKASASTSNNNQNIHFLPFQNQQQMPSIYQSCDLFCMPSLGPGESWGLAINEAMAAGKPVLTSNRAGASIDLVNEENGAIFESADFEDFKTKLTILTKDKQALSRMGIVSYNRIQAWSFQRQLSAIYAE